MALTLTPPPPLTLPFLRSKTLTAGRRRSITTASASELEAAPSKESPPGVEESVRVLKSAAKTRRVPQADVLSALAAIKKAKVDPSQFLETLGGTQSPGRTWMLIFTAQGKLEKGRYFPITAVQRFDASVKRIENGVYLGPIGSLTFEGKFLWKSRILSFIFECIRIKVGPFGPLQINFGGEDREPSTKDPFFIWFYIDEEIAVAQGRSGGIQCTTAFLEWHKLVSSHPCCAGWINSFIFPRANFAIGDYTRKTKLSFKCSRPPTTLARYQLPVVMVILNNGDVYGGDRRNSDEITGPYKYDSAPTSFVPGAAHHTMMEAFCGKGYLVSTPQELKSGTCRIVFPPKNQL